MVRGAIWVFCWVWTRPDGWRRRPSQWPAHNVLQHQHVDLWGIYPTKPEAGVYNFNQFFSGIHFNFYSSSRMFLSCNLCMFFEFIFVDLQIVIPGCLYQLNLINLNELISCLFTGSHMVTTAWEETIYGRRPRQLPDTNHPGVFVLLHRRGESPGVGRR